ncbi:hypothetical protein [Helicobacter marmotae]|uniref:hypothetical protein n=1 Tax=Helicobacter marmotae TaxID=152490 RepID=UPI0011C04587|nr:hypothetical protein [Helicobacter marmotae]
MSCLEPPIRGEESLLSAKDSSTESPERRLVCHSERSEESLNESLVTKRDSSLDSQALDMTK